MCFDAKAQRRRGAKKKPDLRGVKNMLETASSFLHYQPFGESIRSVS
jgi:hypothetical protein